MVRWQEIFLIFLLLCLSHPNRASAAVTIGSEVVPTCESRLAREFRVQPTSHMVQYRSSNDRKVIASRTPTAIPFLYQLNLFHRQRYLELRASAQVEVDLWHGFGDLNRSHGGSMFEAMRIFSAHDYHLHNRVSAHVRKSRLLYVRTWATAPDLPYCGNFSGGISDALSSGDIGALSDYVKWRKSLNPGAPLVIAARSSAAIPLLEVNYRNPGMIQGIILMNPIHPTAGWEEAFEIFQRMIGRGQVPPNLPSIEWVFRVRNQLTWHNDPHYSQGTPILTLFSGKDQETPASTRKWFGEQSSETEYDFFKDGEHDLLQIRPQPDGSDTQVHERIQRFLRERVLNIQIQR